MPPPPPDEARVLGGRPSQPGTTETDNRLLAALPREELDRLRPALETVHLGLKEEFYAEGKPLEHVWFPHRGVASLLNRVPEGRAVEFATTGNEGFIGVQVLLGAESMPSMAFAQIPVTASRMEAGAFRAALGVNPSFHALLLRYTMALLNQVAQNAACNRAHPIEERCARWLLMTHDRVNGDRHFPLTQEFLAQMLGVRRASVSVAEAMLQKAGLIRYTRGTMTVLDREGLEAASCPCYGVLRAEFDRLLP
ncbi:Crp/Fnr family transcriptional regulator [Sabulicella rubraurantiaca]|uniref:Crp/Fnr family transcriptional regulator n=1 Tax=Sabulicella rubraurantiaca TaxID=2811429 RepID=UPI001A95D3A0|nr:Crp/Fnr family transcriptional regulator [Sabulicella rubraurantiaca]